MRNTQGNVSIEIFLLMPSPPTTLVQLLRRIGDGVEGGDGGRGEGGIYGKVLQT